MARKIVRGSGSMSLEEALNNPNYGNSYNSIESVALDPAMSQEVADILTDNLPDNGFYFLGQAEVCSKEAWEWGNECQRLINERNQKIRACKALSASKGGEAIDYWNVMSTENEVTDFGKRVWEAIKNAIKKLILMIINFIKSVGNFIKGAMAKAQELFWKKYRREVETAKESVGTMKIKAQSASKIWGSLRPDMYLKKLSGNLASAFNTASVMINSTSLDDKTLPGLTKDIIDIVPNGDKAQVQTGKWFPSAGKVVNEGTYGVEKPGKFEVSIETIISEGKDLLEAQTLQVLAASLKCGQVGNKALSNILKRVEGIAKTVNNEAVATKGQNKYESKANKGVNAGNVQNVRRYLQFCTTLLLHAYGNALSARMMVFSAARKKVRGSSKADKEKAKKDASKDVKDAEKEAKNAFK